MFTLLIDVKVFCSMNLHENIQESRAVVGNPRDAAVIFDP